MRIFVKNDFDELNVYEISYIGWKNDIFERLEDEFIDAEDGNEENLAYLKELFTNKGYFEFFDLNCDTSSFVFYIDRKDAEEILLFITENGYADLRKYHYCLEHIDFFFDDVKDRWMKGYFSRYR